MRKQITKVDLSIDELKEILINHFDLDEDTKISFKVDQERIYSRYDDPRDPPSYKSVVKKVTLKHEKEL